MFSTPICVPIVFTNDNLVKGSTIKLLIEFNGKNCVIFSAIELSGKTLKVNIPVIIPSMTFQTNKKPSAKAERLTNIPKNKQKEKNPINFTKYAKRYSKSEKIIENSL